MSPSKDLSANETIFGWVISDYCESPSQAITAYICCRAETSSKTDELVRALCVLYEEPPTDANNISSDEQLAITHFQDTFRRDSDGRYIAALLFKEFPPSLGQSRPMAAKCLEQNQRILLKKDKWCDFQGAVDEYQVLDHAEVVPQSDLKKLPSDAFYLPMHGVEKEASTTTELRIVFDASAKTTSGYSLNDQLLTGPNLYPLLTNVLMKFRLHRIGMSADISKMFRELSLRKADRDWHRYLVKKKDCQIQDCRMKCVTVGVKSFPFLATQVLRQLAMDYRD